MAVLLAFWLAAATTFADDPQLSSGAATSADTSPAAVPGSLQNPSLDQGSNIGQLRLDDERLGEQLPPSAALPVSGQVSDGSWWDNLSLGFVLPSRLVVPEALGLGEAATGAALGETTVIGTGTVELAGGATLGSGGTGLLVLGGAALVVWLNQDSNCTANGIGDVVCMPSPEELDRAYPPVVPDVDHESPAKPALDTVTGTEGGEDYSGLPLLPYYYDPLDPLGIYGDDLIDDSGAAEGEGELLPVTFPLGPGADGDKPSIQKPAKSAKKAGRTEATPVTPVAPNTDDGASEEEPVNQPMDPYPTDPIAAIKGSTDAPETEPVAPAATPEAAPAPAEPVTTVDAQPAVPDTGSDDSEDEREDRQHRLAHSVPLPINRGDLKTGRRSAQERDLDRLGREVLPGMPSDQKTALRQDLQDESDAIGKDIKAAQEQLEKLKSQEQSMTQGKDGLPVPLTWRQKRELTDVRREIKETQNGIDRLNERLDWYGKVLSLPGLSH